MRFAWLRVSGGERQLALVARALAQEPRILVLDEPTASLDFGNQLRVLDAVRRLAETPALSVLLSTHHPEQAFSCAEGSRSWPAANCCGSAVRPIITAETLRACYSVDVAVLPVADGRYRVCVRAPTRLTTAAGLIRRRGAAAPRRRVSARIFGGDIGRSRSRAPVAAWIALATAAIGGTIGTSPTPRTPNGMARVRHLDEDRVDHRHVGRDRAAVVEKARVIHAALLVVDVFLVERPADALGDAALDLALDIGWMDRAADILRRGVAQHRDMAGLGIDLDIADMRREGRARRLAR